jgi:alpha-glucoside transport system substrate-binding protein
MDEKYTVGGAQGTLSTPFLEAIYKPFSDPPEAMMVKQSGFAGGEVAKQFPDLAGRRLRLLCGTRHPGSRAS